MRCCVRSNYPTQVLSLLWRCENLFFLNTDGADHACPRGKHLSHDATRLRMIDTLVVVAKSYICFDLSHVCASKMDENRVVQSPVFSSSPSCSHSMGSGNSDPFGHVVCASRRLPHITRPPSSRLARRIRSHSCQLIVVHRWSCHSTATVTRLWPAGCLSTKPLVLRCWRAAWVKHILMCSHQAKTTDRPRPSKPSTPWACSTKITLSTCSDVQSGVSRARGCGLCHLP